MSKTVKENQQEAINKDYEWFIVQEHGPSVDNFKNCVYLSKEGGRCAVGVLISADKAREFDSAECSDIESLVQSGQARYIGRKYGLGFLKKLQGCHDGSIAEYRPFNQEYPERLRYLCQQYKLQWPGDKYEQPS